MNDDHIPHEGSGAVAAVVIVALTCVLLTFIFLVVRAVLVTFA